MDNFDSSSSGNENLDKPIPFNDDDMSGTDVSHSPLNLGGGAAGAPTAGAVGQPVKPVAKPPTERMVSSDRIMGVKTFFTKLHPGAIEFLDEQITRWLNDNPGIVIKRTNTVTGMIQGKKTEPNIVITVWY